MAVINPNQESRRPPSRRRQLFSPNVPFYRDVRIQRIFLQVLFLLVFGGGLYFAIDSLVGNLAESNIPLDFDVYRRPFNAEVSEGIPINTTWSWVDAPNLTGDNGWWVWVGLWLLVTGRIAWGMAQKDRVRAGVFMLGMTVLLALQPWLFREAVETLRPYLQPSTNTRAIITGIFNTLRVVILCLFASTFIGVLAGIGLLSRNLLLRTFSLVYVEIFRNTPLLVQLIFVYSTMIILLPAPRFSLVSPDSLLGFPLYEKVYFINARGFYFPAIRENASAQIFYAGIAIACVVGYALRRWRLSVQENTGAPARTWRYVIPAVLGITLGGWWLAGGFPLGAGPFNVEYPFLRGANVQGGLRLNVAFVALFIGLTLYTAAFIADIVRAGIQAVPYGQIEAARAHGLSGGQVLNLVVLPQALRLIIPPLGNQYVNMGKNSSLGIAVTYADTYLLVTVANNETGQAVPFFVGLMLIYLTLSLTLSLLTNILNNLTQIRTR